MTNTDAPSIASIDGFLAEADTLVADYHRFMAEQDGPGLRAWPGRAVSFVSRVTEAHHAAVAPDVGSAELFALRFPVSSAIADQIEDLIGLADRAADRIG